MCAADSLSHYILAYSLLVIVAGYGDEYLMSSVWGCPASGQRGWSSRESPSCSTLDDSQSEGSVTLLSLLGCRDDGSAVLFDCRGCNINCSPKRRAWNFQPLSYLKYLSIEHSDESLDHVIILLQTGWKNMGCL